jgi:hypothetical protein
VTQPSSRLDRLFDLYSSDLRRLDRQYADQFLCPLCLGLVKRVPKLGDVVAVEHIVPRALGGRLLTLTCRNCNSDHGTTLDAHLVRRVRVESGEHAVSVRVSIGAGEHGAEMRLPDLLNGEIIRLVGISKQSDPAGTEAAMRALDAGEKTIRLRMSFGYTPLRSCVALIRAAYLLMFRMFGYSYICDASAQAVLHQIRNPREQMAVVNGIVWRVPEPLPQDHLVSVLTAPDHLRSFVVFLKLNASPNHVSGVMLPAPGNDGSTVYSAVQSPDTPKRKIFRGIPLPHDGFWPFITVWKHFAKAPRGQSV